MGEIKHDILVVGLLIIILIYMLNSSKKEDISSIPEFNAEYVGKLIQARNDAKISYRERKPLETCEAVLTLIPAIITLVKIKPDNSMPGYDEYIYCIIKVGNSEQPIKLKK